MGEGAVVVDRVDVDDAVVVAAVVVASCELPQPAAVTQSAAIMRGTRLLIALQFGRVG
jgi:hypothetical protein